VKRLGKIWDLPQSFVLQEDGRFPKKAALRRPARLPAELGAFVPAQIIETE
jgi:hypothetical protein